MKIFNPCVMVPCNGRSLSELPFDIIIEILSWSSVKTLLRFRCVCKQWCSLIQDDKFIAKHMDRSAPMDLAADKKFRFISYCAGLLLEKSYGSSISRVFRIRNAALQQLLYLPQPSRLVICMDLAFNSITHEFKVVCFFTDWKDDNIRSESCFKVMAIGKDEPWRKLMLPNRSLMYARGEEEYSTRLYPSKQVCKDSGILHVVEIDRVGGRDGTDLHLQIHSLDIWKEYFTTNTLPHGIFADLKRVQAVFWGKSISIADITDETVNFLVLEDFKQHKWSKSIKKVPLRDCRKLRKDRICLDGFGLQTEGSCAIAYEERREAIFGYFTTILYKPSLVTLKGMIPENVIIKNEHN